MRCFVFHLNSKDLDFLLADLSDYGTLGVIEESETSIRAFFDDSAGLSALLASWNSVALEIRKEAPAGPLQLPPEDFEPVLVGESFFIASDTTRHSSPPGRRRLVIDSTNAFGSGRHESTHLVIQALETCLNSGDVVLDIGCGSGILSQAALMLGAGCIYACDISGDAISVARRHTPIPIFLGSADSIRDSVADIALVNISAKVIDALAFELSRIVKPGGRLLLAGFVRENPPCRFIPELTLEMNEWLCWICRPELVLPPEHNSAIQPFEQRWW